MEDKYGSELDKRIAELTRSHSEAQEKLRMANADHAEADVRRWAEAEVRAWAALAWEEAKAKAFEAAAAAARARRRR
jgi:hypothetical protein